MKRPFIFVDVANPPTGDAVEVLLRNNIKLLACYCRERARWVYGPDNPEEGTLIPLDLVDAWRPIPGRRIFTRVTCSDFV